LTFVSAGVGSEHEVAVVATVRPELETVTLGSVTFLSDHGVLTDNDANWGGGGARFPEPEWTAAAQHPITHTMGEKLRVKVKLVGEPANAAPTKMTLVGRGPNGIDFRQRIVLGGGEQEVELLSDDELPRRVEAFDLDFSWSVQGTDAEMAATETSTTVYITVDAPIDAARVRGVTLKRMKKAVEAVGGANSLKPHQIVRSVIQKWNHFNLKVAHYNAWKLGEDETDPATGELIGADCQTIVRVTRNAIKLVGVPGEAKYVVVWAKVKTPAKGEESENAANHMTKPRQYYNDHNRDRRSRRNWIAALVDGGGGLNNYEAALKFSHGGKQKYYPGGVRSVLDSPDDVIGVFTTMSWVDITKLKDGAKEHIHHYR
jgi:hypothetical protein